MKNLCIVFMISALFLSGCSFGSISHGSEISEQQLTEIKSGVTTKKDIYRAFGEPTKVVENGSIFFYSWTRGGQSSFLGMGSTETDTKSLMVEFDNDGIVKEHRITRGSPVGSN
jgi:outer membrane protein assembly factor BamE (lipoprotein component of BamABCDE complex)